jgi:hypothetical protein
VSDLQLSLAVPHLKPLSGVGKTLLTLDIA